MSTQNIKQKTDRNIRKKTTSFSIKKEAHAEINDLICDEIDLVRGVAESAATGAKDWYTDSVMIAPTADLKAVTADNPVINLTLIAKEVGTYNNLKLADGSTAPAIVVTPEEADPNNIYDRIEIRYNATANTWTKVPIEKRKISTETTLGELTTIGTALSSPVSPMANRTGYEINPNLQATNRSRYLRKFNTYAAYNGTMTIAVGSVGVDMIFRERANVTLNLISGSNSVDMPADFIQREGEHVGIKLPSTAVLTYVPNPNPGTIARWGTEGYDGVIVANDTTNVMNYGFDVQEIYPAEAVSYQDFESIKALSLDNQSQLSELRVDMQLGAEKTYGSTQNNAGPLATGDVQSYQMTPSIIAAEKELITQIAVTTQQAGLVRFAIGSLDQHDIFIEKKEISFNVDAGGAHVYDLTDEKYVLEVGDRVAYKTPASADIRYSYGAPEGRYVAVGYNNQVDRVTDTINRLAYSVVTKTVVALPNIASYEDLVKVKTQLTALENKPAPPYIDEQTGDKYRIIVSGGNLLLRPLNPSKIVVLGNSFDKHGITTYWWGEYGMAATSRENDWVHRFLNKVKTAAPAATIDVMNVAAWEADMFNWDKNQMNTILKDADLVIVSHGENSYYDGNYKNHYKTFVQHVRAQVPSARIIVGGMRWAHTQKDVAKFEVSSELGLQFVQLSQFDTPQSRSTTADTLVMGDDGQMHRVGDGTPAEIVNGVVNHWGDVGMESIAQTMFDALGL